MEKGILTQHQRKNTLESFLKSGFGQFEVKQDKNVAEKTLDLTFQK